HRSNENALAGVVRRAEQQWHARTVGDVVEAALPARDAAARAFRRDSQQELITLVERLNRLIDRAAAARAIDWHAAEQADKRPGDAGEERVLAEPVDAPLERKPREYEQNAIPVGRVIRADD